MDFHRIGVLLGGLSAEREVSLRSGRAVAEGLARSGFEVVEIDAGRDLAAKLHCARVDAVYIALHGRMGEDGTVQGLLEVMGLPYTGSGVLASALCMDKIVARNVLAAHGVPVAPGWSPKGEDDDVAPQELSLPVVVKPSDEGSSVGVTIVREPAHWKPALTLAFGCSRRVIVEKFIEGTELTVAVLDGEPLGTLEIEPHAAFYDYDAKYAPGGSTHHVPARIGEARTARALELAQKAFAAACCKGAARVDMIAPRSESEDLVVLEINTVPGMTQRSLLPEIAAAAGLGFDELVTRIVRCASTKTRV
ncbi:MAG: D-alanine--D-alanine ligase [Myxococcota bacterium]|jgi:D-alanine-D-alanine ligase|nr:D-alanine--D-alanine ligase [Myxococcota bacterium]